jgi:hypothetical protein
LALGPHAVQVTFNDTAAPANSWTNSWSFSVVGSVPVLGFYQFNEKARATRWTTRGAILDASGYARHATATGALAYVSGSLDYGNSSALQFLIYGGRARRDSRRGGGVQLDGNAKVSRSRR